MHQDNEERLIKIAEDYVSQTSKRKLLPRLIMFAILLLLVLWIVNIFIAFFEVDKNKSVAYVGVLDFSGIIAAQDFEGVITASRVNNTMRKIMQNKMSQGIILKMNSGGGSPVQSELMFNAIQQLRKEYPKKPIITVVEEICASGCYFVAAATDKIYASKSSIIGSIGVRFDSFGLSELLNKVGVEPRIFSAGKNKLFLDPFTEITEDDKQYLEEEILGVIYNVFVDAVKSGRGNRLTNNSELFSGQIWLGEAAVDNGLIDGIGSIRTVAKQEFKTNNLQIYYPKANFFDKLKQEFNAVSNIVEQLQIILQETNIKIKT